jgi:hypothetical protein
MTQAPETQQPEGCKCPEVRLTDQERAALMPVYQGIAPEWISFCEYREEFTGGRFRVPLDSASPEPTNWRCPKCKRSIVRLGVTPVTDEDVAELEGVANYFGVDSSAETRFTPADEFFRIYFGCQLQTCGWNGYVISFPNEGLVAGPSGQT